MIWNGLAEFLDMGGYAVYVWGSVLVTFGFMLAELVILNLRRRAIFDHLARSRDAGVLSGDEQEVSDEGKA